MKVLIVDDSPLLCRGLGRAIARKDVFHRAAHDGRSALDEIRESRYDLVLLDIHLPDANGLDLLKEIRRIRPDTKVVMISSDASESNIEQALAGGAFRFMPKPFDLSDLYALLEAVRPDQGCGAPPRAGAPAGAIPGRTSESGTEETGR